MHVRIQGAHEHNLTGIDVEFGDGLTVVTGVSGSGKTSLVFDTLYHEARRRFLEVFSAGASGLRLQPAEVESITGLGPAVAVGQNLLNRNPGSTLASASGLHPFLRLLYARFGERHCARCGAALSVLTEDEIVERVVSFGRAGEFVTVYAPLLRGVRGSHRTLLLLLSSELTGPGVLCVDGGPWDGTPLDPGRAHDLDVRVACLEGGYSAREVRQAVQVAWSLGATAISFHHDGQTEMLSRGSVCVECGSWFGDLEPMHFHTACPHCFCQTKTGPFDHRKEGHFGHSICTLTIENRST